MQKLILKQLNIFDLQVQLDLNHNQLLHLKDQWYRKSLLMNFILKKGQFMQHIQNGKTIKNKLKNSILKNKKNPLEKYKWKMKNSKKWEDQKLNQWVHEDFRHQKIINLLINNKIILRQITQTIITIITYSLLLHNRTEHHQKALIEMIQELKAEMNNKINKINWILRKIAK